MITASIAPTRTIRGSIGADSLRRMALADEFDGLLVDLDGVVWVGREPVPGPPEALRELIEGGKRGRLRHQQPGPAGLGLRRAAARDRASPVGGGAGSSPPAMVTADLGGASAAGAGARRLRDRRSGLQGDGGARPASSCSTARRGARPHAVVVSGHRGFDYEELLTATLALQRRGDAVRDQPRPDPADAGRRLAGDRRGAGRDRDRDRRERRDRRQARAPPVRAGPGSGSRRRRAGGDGRRPDRLRHRGRPAGRPRHRSSSSAGPPRARTPRPPSRRPTTSSTTSRRCCDERAPSGRRVRCGPASPSPGSSPSPSAGLLAVGAVLPVLPRYVHGPLDGGNIAVGIVVGSYAATGLLLRPDRRPLRRPQRPPADGARRLAAGRRSPASSTCCRSGFRG